MPASAPRLYVSAPLAARAEVPLSEGQAHYLRNVLRQTPGATLTLFNGRDGEWQATLETLSKSAATARADSQRRPQQTPPDLWLLFAPIKRTRIDLIAEKATELGATRLLPTLTRHTDVARTNTERLAAHALEAAEQCGRLDVPEVTEPETLEQRLHNWPQDRRLLVCAEHGPAQPIAAALRQLPPGPAALLVGPEGGFSEAELTDLAARPFVTMLSLGPRILRAETAVIAALACWQSLCGDSAP